MTKSAKRPLFGGDYPGTDVTPQHNAGPGLAPETLVAHALLSSPSFDNHARRILSNPTTGEVSVGSKWKTDRNVRRRSEWRSNTLTPDFRSVGGEGAITFGGTAPGAATNTLATAPRVRITSGAAVGNSKTAATGFGLFRWRWDCAAGFWIQTVAFNNCRYWFALTSATLDQVAPITGAGGVDVVIGAGGRVVAWCLDAQTFGSLNWRTVVWDGTTLTITDTGIDGAGKDNTFFMPSFEIDTAGAVARFYLYDRSGIDHGLVNTVAFAPAVTDVFGLECVVQNTNLATAKDLDLTTFWCEHAP